MTKSIETESMIKSTCELEDKEFEVVTDKKQKIIKIFNLGGSDRNENPIFVSKLSKDDDIVECHQKMIEYMMLNNVVPQSNDNSILT